MASHVSLTTGDQSSATVNPSTGSPKGACVCSPTTHQGSFRCKLHRSQSSAWMKRSNSLPVRKGVSSSNSSSSSVASLSPKSVESAN